MKRAILLALLVLILVGVGVGAAATLNVGSNHLWAGSQALTKGTCTLTGTTQSTDTYVDQSRPTNSFGGNTTMLVQPDSGTQKQSLVMFDLSKCPTAIPSTGGADTATLSLRITSAPRSSRTLTVTPVTSSWTGTTTWNTAPSVAGAATTTFATGTSANTVSIAVTVDVDDFIKGNLTNYGWRISDGGSAASQDTTTFATSNAASNKPTLTINYEK